MVGVGVALDKTVLVPAAVSLYICSLFPAPQYSTLFPGQVKLQSVVAANTEPELREFPQ